MKSMTMRFICRMLVVSLAMLPFQSIQAGMIGADQVAAVVSAQAERQALVSLISRSDVAGQMQSLGVDLKTATDRVAAMTDEEVHSLTGKLDSLPAGAKNSGWAWLIVIVIGVLIYVNYKK